MIIKTFLLFILLLMIGGFGYIAVSEPTIHQRGVTKTMSLSEIEAAKAPNEAGQTDEEAE